MITRSHAIIITSVVLLTASQAAFSEPNISGVVIEKVGYAGNGCPAGSASVVLASDKKSVSFLFDDFTVTVGGYGQRTFARKKCDVAVGMKIPEGISISILDADYRGFINLPSRAKAAISIRTKRGLEASMALNPMSCLAPTTTVRYNFRYKSCGNELES